MKTMNCKQLGGACEKEFQANTFEEMSELSKQHGMEMHQKQDAAHLEAMQEMQGHDESVADPDRQVVVLSALRYQGAGQTKPHTP